jgi:hypothetical protein
VSSRAAATARAKSRVERRLPLDGPDPHLLFASPTSTARWRELGSAYGHIAITSDDLDATLERLAEQAIEPEKPPYSAREGGSRLCFVRDPESPVHKEAHKPLGTSTASGESSLPLCA